MTAGRDDAAMVEAMLDMNEEGYRANLDAAGWGEGDSRRMAADYHSHLLWLIRSAQASAKKP